MLVEQRVKIMTYLLLSSAVGASACTVESEEEASAALCSQPLTSSVVAPEWVRNVSPIRSYQYQTELDGVEASVDLIGDQDLALGRLRVTQRYGDPAYPDGAMQAELSRDGHEPMRLTTVGEMIDGDGYRVRGRLEQGASAVDVVATLAHRSCYASRPAQAPLCAGEIPLGEPSFLLPSCGLVLDEMLLMGRAPTLERLYYAAAEPGASLPELAVARYEGGARLISVVGPDGLTDSGEVADWAREVGVDGLIGSESEVLLTTAFLDRTWWRELERHASHCAGESPDNPLTTQSTSGRCGGGLAPQSEPVASRAQALCAGTAAKPSPSDWSDDGASQDTGGFWGDPHMTSLDRTAFDFQGTGEFVLLESLTDPRLVVQARFEPLTTSSTLPACANVSVGTALAVLAGEQRVTAYARPAWSARLDGQELAAGQAIALSDGGVARVTPGHLLMEWPTGERIELSAGDSSRLRIALSPARSGQVRGLLGQLDDNPANDFMTRDGRLLPSPPGFEALYSDFGASWRVSEADSLFEYAPGESADTFSVPGFPSQPSRLEDLPADAVDDARQACASLEITDPVLLRGCILDVVCAGPEAARSAVGVPSPRAFLPPERPELMVEGQIAFALAPAELDPSPWLEPSDESACQAPAPRTMLLFPESDLQTLAADFNLDAAGPAASGGVVPAGTAVTSYLIHRRPSTAVRGAVYFQRPILGVVTSQSALASSDELLGNETTTYPTDPRGLEDEQDEVTIAADGRSLVVSLAGDDVDQIRVLTEAP